jgi:hypothetical protein
MKPRSMARIAPGRPQSPATAAFRDDHCTVAATPDGWVGTLSVMVCTPASSIEGKTGRLSAALQPSAHVDRRRSVVRSAVA